MPERLLHNDYDAKKEKLNALKIFLQNKAANRFLKEHDHASISALHSTSDDIAACRTYDELLLIAKANNLAITEDL